MRGRTSKFAALLLSAALAAGALGACAPQGGDGSGGDLPDAGQSGDFTDLSVRDYIVPKAAASSSTTSSPASP